LTTVLRQYASVYIGLQRPTIKKEKSQQHFFKPGH